jgi:hypothetical protein
VRFSKDSGGDWATDSFEEWSGRCCRDGGGMLSGAPAPTSQKCEGKAGSVVDRMSASRGDESRGAASRSVLLAKEPLRDTQVGVAVADESLDPESTTLRACQLYGTT